MRLDAWLLVGCVALVSETALAGNFSSSLKNFYAEYEVVKQCQQETQLSVADTELAKGAIAKIEAYYMKRDTSIDKERLLKQAVSDKNDGFRIATRNRNSDLRSFCQVSLKELLDVPGRGYIGLEEDVLVTADGSQWLSTAQRELWLVPSEA